MQATQLQTEISPSSSSEDRRARIGIVEAENVERLWPTIASVLGALVEQSAEGRMGLEDLHEQLQQSLCKAMLITDDREILGAFILEIDDYPKRRVCSIPLLAGKDMHRWIHLLSAVETWAKEQGCDLMEIRGRRGWKRMTGYEERYTVFTKELGDGKNQ